MPATPTPDRWSLDSWFSAFRAPDYLDFKTALTAEVDSLKKAASGLTDDLTEIARVLTAFETLGVRATHLSSYLGCLSADDAANEDVNADKAWMAGLEAEQIKLTTAIQSTLANLSEESFTALLNDPSLASADSLPELPANQGAGVATFLSQQSTPDHLSLPSAEPALPANQGPGVATFLSQETTPDNLSPATAEHALPANQGAGVATFLSQEKTPDHLSLPSAEPALPANQGAGVATFLSQESTPDHLSPASAEHALRRMRNEGRRQMPVELESLAADLNVDGLHAWGRLYDTLTGQMKFDMTFPDGHSETVPMSRRRALMSEPNRKLREAAFHAGQKPWEEHAVTLAAALNGIAGTRLKLYERRGIAHFLETPLFDSAMSQASLDAMMTAIRQEIDLPRRALRKAAKLQGTSALHYFDLEAPQVAAPEGDALTWDAACAKVDAAFTAAYPKLGGYFREMLQRRWIEAQPRPGKRPGAFCTGSLLRKEERIYMTFYGTVHDMVTLAHEAGHAWHGRVMFPQRPFATRYPMTLAETASNFGEMILLDGLMNDPAITAETKAYLLDQEMLRAHAYLINIPMRFEFERAFYTERAAGEVSVSRLRDLMTQAQKDLYGDTLLPDGADPMFWSSKMHFFISELSFYNFPYTVGYLLSQALYARFKAEGPAFLPKYEAFLAATGSADCEAVAQQTLGADLTSPDFWRAGVRGIESSVAAYEALYES